MDLIKAMKERIAKSGANKKEILYFGKDCQAHPFPPGIGQGLPVPVPQ